MASKIDTEINLKIVLAAVAIVSMIAGGGGSWMALKMSVSSLKEGQVAIKEDVAQHHSDTDKHMSFERKVSMFVSREEFIEMRRQFSEQDTRQRAMLATLSRIEENLATMHKN